MTPPPQVESTSTAVVSGSRRTIHTGSSGSNAVESSMESNNSSRPCPCPPRQRRNQPTTGRLAYDRTRSPAWRLRLNIPFLSGSFVTRWFRTVFDAGVAYFAAAHIDPNTVERLSVMAVLLHMAFRQTSQYLETVSAPDPSILYYLVMVLAAVSTLSSGLVLWMKCYPTHSVVFAGMIALFLVEALSPVTLVVCFLLTLSGVVSAVESLLITVSVFAVASSSSWCIRTVLYPNLGHG